ncbi:MAG TPA: GNAT family N-acetyltransferase [Pyrinomonadaceae bacterium]|jgi:GNAT superfamily N-acetyltransferase
MTLFADHVLARRLELHEGHGIAGSVKTLGVLKPDDGVAVEMVAGAYAIYAGASSPISRAIGLGMNGALSAAEVSQAEEFYLSRQTNVQIDLCPLADASLKTLLNERGYQLGDFVNVWFRFIADYEATKATAAGIKVRETEPADADAWIRSVSGGFVEREELTEADMEVATNFFHDTQTRCFLSIVDGQAAGGGALYIHEGIAALFSGSTLPNARGRGAQTALVHARLEAARDAGCELAVVKTAPGNASQRNVQRAGFHLAYTKVVMIREYSPANL